MSTPAIELLTKAAEICKANAKINREEGNIEQAELNEKNAGSYIDSAVLLQLTEPE